MLAVGDRRVGGEAAGLVRALVRPLDARGACSQITLPSERRSAITTKRHSFSVARPGGRARRRGAAAPPARRRRLPRRRRRRLAGVDRGGDEHAIAPHDGRRRALAGDGHLPAHVLGLRPLDRRVGVRRDAGLGRARASAASCDRSRSRRRRRAAGTDRPDRTRRKPPRSPRRETSGERELSDGILSLLGVLVRRISATALTWPARRAGSPCRCGRSRAGWRRPGATS